MKKCMLTLLAMLIVSGCMDEGNRYYLQNDDRLVQVQPLRTFTEDVGYDVRIEIYLTEHPAPGTCVQIDYLWAYAGAGPDDVWIVDIGTFDSEWRTLTWTHTSELMQQLKIGIMDDPINEGDGEIFRLFIYGMTNAVLESDSGVYEFLILDND